MARGWESKSVEQQQEASVAEAQKKLRLTPEQAKESRWREGLLLSRARVVRQLETTSDARYRTTLEAALKDLDAQLERGPR